MITLKTWLIILEIIQLDAKKDLNKLNKIKNVEITKYKKRITKHKKLLNLFNNLSNIILTDKTLESKSQKNKSENEKKESRKEENETENENAKNKKSIINTKKDKNENEDENKSMLLEYIEDVDDKLFKKYSHHKDLIVL